MELMVMGGENEEEQRPGKESKRAAKKSLKTHEEMEGFMQEEGEDMFGGQENLTFQGRK